MEIKVHENKYPKLQCLGCGKNAITVQVEINLSIINLCQECICRLNKESSIIFNNENNHENNN